MGIPVSSARAPRHQLAMNRLLPGAIAAACLFFLAGCQSDNVSVGGVPGWIAEGAKIEEEPEPYKPDPAIIEHGEESGPIEFSIITDKRRYKPAPVKKTRPAHLENDPLERGRAYRLLRLAR